MAGEVTFNYLLLGNLRRLWFKKRSLNPYQRSAYIQKQLVFAIQLFSKVILHNKNVTWTYSLVAQ